MPKGGGGVEHRGVYGLHVLLRLGRPRFLCLKIKTALGHQSKITNDASTYGVEQVPVAVMETAQRLM